MKSSAALGKVLSQPMRFGLVGVLNTAIGYLAYLLGLALGLNYVTAATVSHAIGVTNSFFWNKYWTFRSRGEARSELARFVSVYAVTYVANLVLLALMVEVVGWDARISQAIAYGIVIAISFVGHRYWSFRQTRISILDYRDLRSIGLLLALSLTYFGRSLFTNALMVGNDALQQFYPWRQFAWNVLRQGELPLWNPYAYLGTPFQANIQSALFYPLNLVLLALPAAAAVNYSFISHVFLAGVFTYLFGLHMGLSRFQALVSSVTYMFSGPMVGHVFAGPVVTVQAMAWIPGLFLAVGWALRTPSARRVAVAGSGLGLAILTGYPQAIFMTMLAVSLYVLWLLIRSEGLAARAGLALAYVGIVALGVLLAAAQLLPTFEYMSLSVRNAGGGFGIAAYDSLPPHFLANLVTPDLFGNFVDDNYWGIVWGMWHEYQIYLGIVPLALAGLAIWFQRRNPLVLFFGLVSLLFLILALGKYTPVYRILFEHVPGFALFRGPTRHFLMVAFFMAMLAGFGAEAVLAGRRLRQLRIGMIVAMVCSLALLIVGNMWREQLVDLFASTAQRTYEAGVLKMPGFKATDYYMQKLPMIFGTALRSLYLPTVVLALFSALLFIRDRLTGRLASVFLLALIVFDLWSFGAKFNYEPFDVGGFERSEAVGFLRKDSTPFRVLVRQPEQVRGYALRSSSFLLLNNAGTVLGIPFVNGEDPGISERLAEFVEAVNGGQYDPGRWFGYIGLPFGNLESPLLALANLKYVITSEPLQSSHYSLVFDGEEKVYEAKKTLPRAYMVPGARLVASKEEALSLLADPGVDFEREVIITTQKQLPALQPSPGSSLRSDSVDVVENGVNRLRLRTRSAGDGYLVLSEVYYPGWRAYVDGREAEVLVANHLFRSVSLESGEHEVEFVFDPPTLKIGLGVSLATLLIVALAVWLDPGQFSHGKRDTDR